MEGMEEEIHESEYRSRQHLIAKIRCDLQVIAYAF